MPNEATLTLTDEQISVIRLTGSGKSNPGVYMTQADPDSDQSDPDSDTDGSDAGGDADPGDSQGDGQDTDSASRSE